MAYCKTWTGLDLKNMDWIYKTWICKTGLDWICKHGFVKHGLDWICKTWIIL